MHQKLLVRSPSPLVFRNVSAGQKILTEDVIFDQAHTRLIGQWKAPLLIRRFRRSRSRDTLRLLSRRRAATRAQRREHSRQPPSTHHALVADSRPDLSSSAFKSGSRPMKERYSSTGSSLSPRARIFSRNSRPTSRLKIPLSRNRVNASASSTSAHLYE